MIQKIRRAYAFLRDKPFGKQIFACLLGYFIPYSGSPRPQIDTLKPGFARLLLKERRRVANHLGSIHAMALANVAELTAGLALHWAIPKQGRAILTDFSISYVKKARGVITFECRYDFSQQPLIGRHETAVVGKDQSGDVVVTAKVGWLVGEIK